MIKIKLFSIFLAAFLVLIFNSCSKKSNDNMPEDKYGFVKEWYMFDYGGKPTMNTTFTYDSQGRIIHVDGEDQNQSTFTC